MNKGLGAVRFRLIYSLERAVILVLKGIVVL